MFNLFKRKTEHEKLDKQYKMLLKAAFNLSKVNRTASDKKIAEAKKILEKIEKLP